MSDLTNAIEADLQELERLQAETRNAMQRATQNLLESGFKAFFAAFPEVKTIHWASYTPYFNDGDACVHTITDICFSATPHEDLMSPYGDDDEGNLPISGERWDREARGWRPDPNVTPELKAAMTSIARLIERLDPLLTETYGDHRYYRVHSGGLVVEEYDHE
jgi:hypothetical protein